jgi:hypothetical protein
MATTTAPTASTIYGSRTTMGWTASDTGSGVGSYDVRYRPASDRAAAFSVFVYPSTWQRIARFSQTLVVAAGTAYCVSVRARDRAGNTGAWSAERCFRPAPRRPLPQCRHVGLDARHPVRLPREHLDRHRFRHPASAAPRRTPYWSLSW